MNRVVLLLLIVISGLTILAHTQQPVFAQSKNRKVKPTSAITPTPTRIIPPLTPTPTSTSKATQVIRGINYNPIAVGTQVLDSSAPAVDVQKISELGANLIATYNAGLFEWSSYSDVDVNVPFYDNLAKYADQNNIKVMVGYFSNETIDWLDSIRVSKVSTQYKQLVSKSSTRPSTSMILIGNELFEKLPTDISRTAYAKWIGEMTRWTNQNHPHLRVTYADNHAFTALPWLKMHAPELDVYSINSYEWRNALELVAVVDRATTAWDGIPILLHEWGVDSWDTNYSAENTYSQSFQIEKLAMEIDKAISMRPQLIGSVYFEYTDQWDKAGSINTQDPDVASWPCLTCFDSAANEDYWGLTTNTYPNYPQNRTYKSGYSILKGLWN